VVLVICIAPGSNGQHTEALCKPGYTWTYNSLGQIPCDVAAILSTPCSPTNDYHIPALEPGSPGYTIPAKPSICECNTVHYTLTGACAACQGGMTAGLPWTTFKENCTSTWPDGQYPFDIPSNTAVPGWAFQLVEGANRFSMTEALAAKDEPEHKGSTSSSSSSVTTATTTPNTTPGNTAPSSNASSDHTGAIVGGVVGGVAGIAILGGLIVFFIARRRKSSNRYTEIPVASEDRFHRTNPKAYQKGEKDGLASVGAAASRPSWQGTKRPVQEPYYNPDDPDTYPAKGAPDRSFSEDSYTLVGSNQPLGALGWAQHETRAEV